MPDDRATQPLAPPRPAGKKFFGWKVVSAAFVVAVFGWGMGFYGCSIYLYAVQTARGWSVGLVSAAVTAHYLLGALFVANLPSLHRRFGLAAITKSGGIALALGIMGWALASEPWQLFAATILSGAGWAMTGGAAINAMVSPWFQRRRPAALSMAYNGASIGGVVFSPLWVAAIAALGFPLASAVVGLVAVMTLWFLAERYFSRTPEQMGLSPDGDAPAAASASAPLRHAPSLPGARLWRSRRFLTLAGGMAIGLFAQIGLIAHLFSLLVPALGTQLAGTAAAFGTVCAIAGRTLVGWLMPAGADRRKVAAVNYLVQACGCVAFILAAGDSVPLLLLGVMLVGAGIGNATSLPPLIAQAEFSGADVGRAVALITAISQATYAFAPAAFGALRLQAASATSHATPLFFVAAAAIQLVAAACYLSGRRSGIAG
ncbi:MAG TPA: MFS transporter [Stellaceae bacterium]|nr:MFS transporter [Stellaceae bacterium]